MHSLLKAIHSKPGLYFGDGRLPFSAFVGFLAGYYIGRDVAHKPEIGLPEHLVPLDFDAFVCRRLNIMPGLDTKGWVTRIRECTASEQEAFDLLFQLLEAYEGDHTV